MEMTSFMKQARSMTVKIDGQRGTPTPNVSYLWQPFSVLQQCRHENNYANRSLSMSKILPVWFHVYVWIKSSRAWDVYVKTAAVLSNYRTWMCLWILGWLWLCSFLLRNNIFSTVLSCTGFSFLVMTFLHLEKTISNDAEELCCIIQNNCVGLDICTCTYPGVAITHLLGTQQILYLGIKIKEEKKTC